jgi:hypothetical protein
MGALLKERSRKPIIPMEIGITLPTIKYIDNKLFYVAEIREPWKSGGYQVFQLLLTESEMLTMSGEWLSMLARKRA